MKELFTNDPCWTQTYTKRQPEQYNYQNTMMFDSFAPLNRKVLKY